MNVMHGQGRRSHRGAVGRTAAVLGAVVGTLLLTLGLGLPAGAAKPWGPHDPGPRGAAQPPAAAGQHPHALTPLTQANIVVADLLTGNASVQRFSNPAPLYNSSCNTNTTSQLCMTFGTGAGTPNGGTLEVTPTGTLAPGLTNFSSLSVSVGGANCSTSGGGTAAAELDQYTFIPGATPVRTVAIQFVCTILFAEVVGTIAFNIQPTDPNSGYYVFGQQGEITGFGNDNYLVYLDGAQYYNLNAPIVGMAPTPDGAGYWMVGSDGGVFSSGDAGFFGSAGSIHLNQPIVGMAATPDGNGYWFVAADGGIFSYGDAQFYGSTGSIHLNQPIVGMAATPDGKGYWLVASDGGIFSYGDAQFYGSTGSLNLNQPVVGMTPTPDGGGYWFVAADGGIFAYGDAQFYGSTGSISLNAPIVGMERTYDGNGYWFVAADGGVFNYGDAGFAGSLGGSGISDVAGISLPAGARFV